jgi:hypothetical protein
VDQVTPLTLSMSEDADGRPGVVPDKQSLPSSKRLCGLMFLGCILLLLLIQRQGSESPAVDLRGHGAFVVLVACGLLIAMQGTELLPGDRTPFKMMSITIGFSVCSIYWTAKIDHLIWLSGVGLVYAALRCAVLAATAYFFDGK